MGKKNLSVSQLLARFRGWIQAGATLLTNLHLPNFLKGSLYQGADYFTQQVFIKHGKYMAIFTVSSFYEDITGDVLSQFYGIE